MMLSMMIARERQPKNDIYLSKFVDKRLVCILKDEYQFVCIIIFHH